MYYDHAVRNSKSAQVTVDPCLSEPHLSESLFIRTHKFGGEYHYMFVNLIMWS